MGRVGGGGGGGGAGGGGGGSGGQRYRVLPKTCGVGRSAQWAEAAVPGPTTVVALVAASPLFSAHQRHVAIAIQRPLGVEGVWPGRWDWELLDLSASASSSGVLLVKS